jgi:hypothetical protein
MLIYREVREEREVKKGNGGENLSKSKFSLLFAFLAAFAVNKLLWVAGEAALSDFVVGFFS